MSQKEDITQDELEKDGGTNSDVRGKVQVTRYTHFRYSRIRISAVLFQYHKDHQCPIRDHIVKPITNRAEHSPHLAGSIM